jgi:hypothetical protein
MSNILVCKLPQYIVNNIKLYTGEGCWRNGKYIHIHRIPKDDYRYTMLLKRPRIKQIYNNENGHNLKGAVWFKLNTGKFMFVCVKYNRIRLLNNMYYYGYVWELYYDKRKINHLIY